ncbi:hypothetical protein ABT270_25760 [Streptomyces sp900105245]|uniref:hypothetical protein n=1 Tax=Streptomyces sp. 900105245 TaxID=3154379 RepID=UPI00331BB3CE
MDNGDHCQHLVAREMDLADGQRVWVHGFPCGKPTLVRLPGRESCADHLTATTDITGHDAAGI